MVILAITMLVAAPAVADSGPGEPTGADEPITLAATELTATEDDGSEGTSVTLQRAEPLRIRPSVAEHAGEAPTVLARGGGWGHGVGMSQYGAYAQALAGRTASNILTFYYPGTEVLEARDVVGGDGADRRIRVGIQWGSMSTTMRADDAVDLRACGPEGGSTVIGRIGHGDCVDLGVVSAGEEVRICPREDGLDVVPNTGDARTDCAQGQDAEVLFSTTRPVLRVPHHGTRIHTPSAFGEASPRRYSHGYRDYHRAVMIAPDTGDAEPRVHSVQDVPSIEVYLYGLAEVPSSWGLDAPAALQAQAITGRTFALGRPSSRTDCACQVRSTPADQVYNGDEKRLAEHGALWVDAVDASAGRVLTHGGGLAHTFYSSSHGGRTENIEDSWAYGTTAIEYLRSTDDPWSVHSSANNPHASWTAHIDNAELAAFVSSGVEPRFARVERIVVRSRTDGGTPRDIEVTGRTDDGEQLTRTFAGRPLDPKQIAGASFRRFLPVLALGDGHMSGRLRSSQLRDFGFGPFTDDRGSVHEYAISWAAAAGIVQGVDETRFVPGRPVTRAQMATFLFNTFDIPDASETGTFPDVPPDDVHAAAIDAVAEADLASGFEDGTYRPADPVTRAQMASFLTRALALSTTATGTFEDVQPGDTHAVAIEALAETGVTRGCDSTRYCPQDPVLRGQLASFVQRVVED